MGLSYLWSNVACNVEVLCIAKIVLHMHLCVHVMTTNVKKKLNFSTT